MSESLETSRTHMPSDRLNVDGKFFRLQSGASFYIQGVSYGPFQSKDPEYSDPFLPPEATRLDFEKMAAAGFNTLRVYHPPPKWLLDLALEYSLKVLVTLPWKERTLFLDSWRARRRVLREAREHVQQAAGHPAILGYLVDNEWPSDLVRWYGKRRVERFLEKLIDVCRAADPQALFSYANFPPTEYLLPQNVDFYCYNIYLHDPDALRAYLDRLQNLTFDKPLVLGEFGMDTHHHSEEEQAELLVHAHRICLEAGLAGALFFSWTDEWFTDGVSIEDWKFGIVRKDRSPKLAYHALAAETLKPGETLSSKRPLSAWPMVSVIVCSYNGASTLRGCLESLQKLDYPNYEVILVDDGSTDSTPEIAAEFAEKIRVIRQMNQGLSRARNVGMEASRGEIIAYTDSDCMADPRWLYFLVRRMLSADYAAAGGPNLSPPARSHSEAIVAAAPGGPNHVLLTDVDAEHVPGCNMAFWKWALTEIGGFDPIFRKAGDDVDVCWKLLQRGHRIGFATAAFVWHHRRFTFKAFFKQQAGYGEAEAILRQKHFSLFSHNGSAHWRGVIYGEPIGESLFHRPCIYHGSFGAGFYQFIYQGRDSAWRHQVHSIEWWGVTMLFLSACIFHPFFLWAVGGMTILSIVMAGMYARRASIELRHDHFAARALLAGLVLVQPIVRAWVRYKTWIAQKKMPRNWPKDAMARSISFWGIGQLAFWNEKSVDRIAFLQALQDTLHEEAWLFVTDTGWRDWDLRLFAHPFWHIEWRTLTEIYPQGRRVIRISNALTCSTFSAVVWTILTAVVVFLSWFWPGSATLLAAGYSIWLIYWLSIGVRIRRRAAYSLYQTAHRLDMVSMNS